ncbi:M23 family metallopeptidase [Paenibacillus sp. S150]|nr:M23 family metallopeptidase [Paenibacillus sp. S150]
MGSIGGLGLALLALFGLLLVVVLGMFVSSSDSSLGGNVPGQEALDIPPALLPLYIRAEHEGVAWSRLAAIHRVSTNFGLEKPEGSHTVGVFGFPRVLWQAYRVDGDGDGKLDPDNPADVIFSLANYFRLVSDEADAALVQLFPDLVEREMVIAKEREYAAMLVIHSGWLWPLAGYPGLSSAYGYRVDPVTGAPGTFHDGIDIPAPRGTPVLAIQDGTVVQVVKSSSGYGNLIRLEHGGGIESFYAHLTDIGVKKQQTVQRGEVIGWVGNTGKSTGPHLHLGMTQNGQSFNPMLFLRPETEGGL